MILCSCFFLTSVRNSLTNSLRQLAATSCSLRALNIHLLCLRLCNECLVLLCEDYYIAVCHSGRMLVFHVILCPFSFFSTAVNKHRYLYTHTLWTLLSSMCKILVTRLYESLSGPESAGFIFQPRSLMLNLTEQC